MGNYAVIADVGTILVDILRHGLVPELISDQHGIDLASPADKGDLSLGIWLYDIRESDEIRVSGMIGGGLTRQKFPPLYLNLYVMLTAYSGSDLKFRAVQEQRILGRVMQVLHDNPVIPAHTAGGSSGIDLRIDQMNLDIHDQREIWNVTDMPYKTSLFYRISPVELESEKTKRISRVTDIDMTIEEKPYDQDRNSSEGTGGASGH